MAASRTGAHPVTTPAAAVHQPVAVNLLGLVEHPALGESPYRIDVDGRPYVPAGDGGIVLGLRLGDSVFARHADHAAPGACLVHPDPSARQALTVYSCVGNQVQVRTGAAAGANGVVIGKRGEEGRVIAAFRPGDLARLRPADQVSVRARGQGFRPAGFPVEVTLLNLDPDLLASLPVTFRPGAGQLAVGVRSVFGSAAGGNGIGRPAAAWDLDLQLVSPPGGPDVLLGDLVAVSDLDARYNMGYRRGWVTVGVIAHGSSPLPGHGPGMTPIFTGPVSALVIRAEPDRHAGLVAEQLKLQLRSEVARG
ncbi:MAG TPA: DUF4438 domain-containing protein [Streptosporangiaceae bacterium]|nr:DUF4438 domain-containing protein [Streptosporangiaceae bacterium]